MADIATLTTIRPRLVIRCLGGLLGFVAAAPSLFGGIYLLLHPDEIVANPYGSVFPLVLGPLLTWATWRWWTIRGTMSHEEVVLRGWLTTTAVQRSRIADVRRVYTESHNLQIGSRRTWHYELFDYDGNSLGRVPNMMQACLDWERFLERLRKSGERDRTDLS